MRKNEKGAALIFAAVMMAGLFAFSGAAIDIGLMLNQRTRMQLAADAAALAGAKGLVKNTYQASLDAVAVAASNGYAITATNVSYPSPKRVRVEWSSPAGLVLAPFFKLFNVRVGVQSGAEYTGSPNGGGAVPIGVPKQNFTPGQEYVLKPGTGSPNNKGNFGPLVLDCKGAINYENHIAKGSNVEVKVGSFYYTETGNMVGPTEKGFSRRIANDQTSLEDAIANTSPRLVILPILDDGWWKASTGMSPQLVVGFAQFYVTYTAKGEVHGRFVSLLDQSVVPGAGMQYAVKLVE
ncbi:MAG TPA: hypothetical protein DD435_05530 [Cyanobacteria bacterium UBA8530]|nr:hypothetical protein [Cyanobacteria bacterium UBA8530]